MTSCSPLRYPGGKQVIAPVLARIIRLNGLEGMDYAEPYAGGAGAALSLLYTGSVRRLRLNDADPAIASMWQAMLLQTEEFIDRIGSVSLDVAEWKRQRVIYLAPADSRPFDLGFATFYLNRVNRSGIIKNAGPIGGMGQEGNWKIDARFNRGDLASRVRRLASYKRHISISRSDALDFLTSVDHQGTFVYLDPPYFVKGRELYLNHYAAADHAALASYIRDIHKFLWLISYDDAPEIRELYVGLRKTKFQLSYSVRNSRMGDELLISDHSLLMPLGWCRVLPPLNSVRAA